MRKAFEAISGVIYPRLVSRWTLSTPNGAELSRKQCWRKKGNFGFIELFFVLRIVLGWKREKLFFCSIRPKLHCSYISFLEFHKSTSSLDGDESERKSHVFLVKNRHSSSRGAERFHEFSEYFELDPRNMTRNFPRGWNAGAQLRVKSWDCRGFMRNLDNVWSFRYRMMTGIFFLLRNFTKLEDFVQSFNFWLLDLMSFSMNLNGWLFQWQSESFLIVLGFIYFGLHIVESDFQRAYKQPAAFDVSFIVFSLFKPFFYHYFKATLMEHFTLGDKDKHRKASMRNYGEFWSLRTSKLKH